MRTGQPLPTAAADQSPTPQRSARHAAGDVSAVISVRWSLQRPPVPGPPPWLEELRQFRARVLYDGGRRPAFRTTAGRFTDPDPTDVHSFHILATGTEGPVGCMRVSSLAGAAPGFCERLLGRQQLDAALRRVGARPEETAECGGWAVAPDRRRTGIGFRLCAYAGALAQCLGVRFLISAAGTRDRQAQALGRVAGHRPVPGMQEVAVPELDDELRLCFTDPYVDGSPGIRKLTRRLRDEHVAPWLKATSGRVPTREDPS